ncbi:E3 ubiquitin-protein ligase RNF25 [Armigeres subalbatus]|uniref:E3 ubiquitin-protein ligase RNF25 n=1 Tax=Armigeres subalbatus TaxID=124917 RepID=UPI002ED4E9FD
MDALIDEVESLEAILMDDVLITRSSSGVPEMIETTVFPTVGEELDSQYVCITLQVLPGPGYPDVKPNIKLKNPRGLDDQIINSIEAAVRQKLDESVGQPVVFDLIDIIREHLTESNLPSGQCVICLYGFQEGDAFTKTVCYHYLHSHCLACHLNASRRNYDEELSKMPVWKQKETKPYQAQCPVCREPIEVQVEPLSKCRPPSELINAPKFRVTDELKTLQAQMSRLYLHQKSRGGIIDLDAEEGNVISIETEGANSETPKGTNEAPQESSLSENHSNPQTHRQNSASAAVNSQTSVQHDRGSSSRQSGAGPGGSRGHHGNRTNTNRAPQNNGSVPSAEVTEAPQAQQYNSHHHHRGGHRHRRGGHHHHHHHHHHHGGGHHHRGGGGGGGGTTSTSANNATGSGQKNLNNPCTSGAR